MHPVNHFKQRFNPGTSLCTISRIQFIRYRHKVRISITSLLVSNERIIVVQLLCLVRDCFIAFLRLFRGNHSMFQGSAFTQINTALQLKCLSSINTCTLALFFYPCPNYWDFSPWMSHTSSFHRSNLMHKKGTCATVQYFCNQHLQKLPYW